jgi:triosephosphate isomerase
MTGMISKRKIIVANWKMNPDSSLKAKTLFNSILPLARKSKSQIVVCPPFPFLGIVNTRSNNLSLGAQDISVETEGAFTGEVSAKQLRSLGVSFVILGHSERRAKGETSALISKKILTAIMENLTPIVCIGEKERDSEGHFFNKIKEDLLGTLSLVSKKQISKVVIAYEPLWAIGSESKGAMEPGAIHETILFIKKVLSDKYKKASQGQKILYGGSVDQINAEATLNEGTCDGLLVGRASLSKESLKKILESIEKTSKKST